MREKRFEFYSDEDLIGVLDTVTGKTFNSFEIVELLNKLDDERMMYRTTIDKRIVELEEENEKLRNIHLSIDLTYSYGYGRYLADVRVIDDE